MATKKSKTLKRKGLRIVKTEKDDVKDEKQKQMPKSQFASEMWRFCDELDKSIDHILKS